MAPSLLRMTRAAQSGKSPIGRHSTLRPVRRGQGAPSLAGAGARGWKGTVMSIAERAGGDEFFAARATDMKRVVISSVIGTTVEWYDFLIYATASALV